jgi:hypothetical protein
MKCRTHFLFSVVAFCLTEALVAQPRAWTPVVRAGDRLASAPVVIGQPFLLGPRSGVREKGQYVLELEGTGAPGQIRVFFRSVEKPPPDYRASYAVGDLTCSVNQGVEPSDKHGAPKGIVQPEDRPGALNGIVEPEDRPRTLNELGFRANAVANVQVLGPSILVQIWALSPGPANEQKNASSLEGVSPSDPSLLARLPGGVRQCIMKVTFKKAK